MIKGTIDSYELWQSRPENLNENMENPIESAENRGWNQCNRSWIKTIEEQPRVGEWIPISEKLPENIKTVLVTIKELEQPILGWYGNKFGWRIVMPEFVNIKDFTVIAWMPLPEPYKEDANGEND